MAATRKTLLARATVCLLAAHAAYALPVSDFDDEVFAEFAEPTPIMTPLLVPDIPTHSNNEFSVSGPVATTAPPLYCASLVTIDPTFNTNPDGSLDVVVDWAYGSVIPGNDSTIEICAQGINQVGVTTSQCVALNATSIPVNMTWPPVSATVEGLTLPQGASGILASVVFLNILGPECNQSNANPVAAPNFQGGYYLAAAAEGGLVSQCLSFGPPQGGVMQVGCAANIPSLWVLYDGPGDNTIRNLYNQCLSANPNTTGLIFTQSCGNTTTQWALSDTSALYDQAGSCVISGPAMAPCNPNTEPAPLAWTQVSIVQPNFP